LLSGVEQLVPTLVIEQGAHAHAIEEGERVCEADLPGRERPPKHLRLAELDLVRTDETISVYVTPGDELRAIVVTRRQALGMSLCVRTDTEVDRLAAFSQLDELVAVRREAQLGSPVERVHRNDERVQHR